MSRHNQLTLFKKLKESRAPLNLVLFPYLGGYANGFYEMTKELNGSYNIWSAIPPGHGASTLELIEDIDCLIEMYMTEVDSILDRKTIFIGYSMGGVVAYYLLQRLKKDRSKSLVIPETLLIMSSGAPIHFKGTNQSSLSDKMLLDNLSKYEALPEEVFNNDYAAKYLLPIFRADYGILESASRKEIKPLDCEVSLIWGMKDQVVTTSFMLQWKQYFKNPIKLTILPSAKHMFIHENVQYAVAWINKKVFS